MDSWLMTKKSKPCNGKIKESLTNGAGLNEGLHVEEFKLTHNYHLAQNSCPSRSQTSTSNQTH